MMLILMKWPLTNNKSPSFISILIVIVTNNLLHAFLSALFFLVISSVKIFLTMQCILLVSLTAVARYLDTY